MDTEAYDLVIGNIADLAHTIDHVKAIGLSGSHARGTQDALSDIDVCVYVDGELPAPAIRQHAYAQLGFTDPMYLDVDFENSRGDGLRILGTRCDLNWMSISTVRSFLQKLETDFDCPEHIPGGLSTVKELYDPGRMIAGLQNAIPEYSDTRAAHRVSKAIHDAHFSLYSLGWLQKAAFRNDYFLFLKYKYKLLDTLVSALFSLNHAWLSEEKWLVSRIASFEYVPEQIEARLHSIISHQSEDRALAHCLASLEGVFADAVRCIHARYPELSLPVKWSQAGLSANR